MRGIVLTLIAFGIANTAVAGEFRWLVGLDWGVTQIPSAQIAPGLTKPVSETELEDEDLDARYDTEVTKTMTGGILYSWKYFHVGSFVQYNYCECKSKDVGEEYVDGYRSYKYSDIDQLTGGIEATLRSSPEMTYFKIRYRSQYGKLYTSSVGFKDSDGNRLERRDNYLLRVDDFAIGIGWPGKKGAFGGFDFGVSSFTIEQPDDKILLTENSDGESTSVTIPAQTWTRGFRTYVGISVSIE